MSIAKLFRYGVDRQEALPRRVKRRNATFYEVINVQMTLK